MAIEFYKGFDTYVIYGEETSYGAGASPAAGNKIGKVTNVSLNMNNNMIRSQSMGDGRNATSSVAGPFDVSGTLDFDVDDFTFMQYAIGTIQGSGTAADPYELVELDNIGYDATNIPTIALEFGSEGDATDDVTTVSGVVLSGLTLTANAGETLKGSCDWIGKVPTASTSLESYTPSTNAPFVFQQGTVDISGDSFQCTSFSWTLSNNIQTYRNLGDRFIAQPTTGLRRYDFSITFRFKYDDTGGVMSGTELRDIFFGASNTPTTGGALTAKNVSLDISEGAASGDRVVAIDLEDCFINDWTQPMPLEGGVFEITVNGYGHKGLTDSGDLVPIRWYTVA